MKFLNLIFGHHQRPENDSVGQSVRLAMVRNRAAANNLEATIKDLLNENQRLRISGKPNAPNS